MRSGGDVIHCSRVTLARKIAAIALKIWKKGESLNAEHQKSKAA
jgi:hypothetical protein